jgi:hypothetical protein
MLSFTREKVRVDVAPGCQSIVIGVGGETQGIALEIRNEGDVALASLKIKYGHGEGGQWWDALTKAKDFTQPSNFLRKWDGPNPYNLPKGEKSVLYLDVTEIDALVIEAVAVGDTKTYPEPYTSISVNATAIKLAKYGAAAVSLVDPANTSDAAIDGVLVKNDMGFIPQGSESISIYNAGTGDAFIYFPIETGGWKMRAYPPGPSFNWSVGTPYKRYPEIRFDSTNTQLAIAVSGSEIVVGDKAQAQGNLGFVIPRLGKPEGVVKLEWDVTSLPVEQTYLINLYPADAKAYTAALKTAMFESSMKPEIVITPADPRTGMSNLTLTGVPAGNYKLALSRQGQAGALLREVAFKVA